MFSGARKGLTGVSGDSSAFHFTTGLGQAVRSHGGHAGHTVGGGHFISGQRGRGQAGHSPQSLPHEELSTMIGSGVGTELLSTYCERSGTGGHCVFSIYWLMSGHVAGGGIELLRTYFDMSGGAGQPAAPHELHIGFASSS
jgi:hypothetical protein